jgi:glycosyltransferase involved in cell wall biosynthesis
MLSFVIVSPSFNQANYLNDCLRSVEQQMVPRTHIVVDSLSQDGSQQILQEFSEQPRHYSFQYISEKDQGQSNAINKGWQMVQGDVYSWLNSDDILCPNALTYVSEAFQQHPEVDFIYGDCQYIDQQGNLLGLYPVEAFDYIKLVSNAESTIPQPACFIRADALRRAGPLREDLHYVMDLDLWLRLGANGKGLYIQHTLAYLRLHDQAKSIKHLSRFGQELIKLYQDFFQAHQNTPRIQALKNTATYRVMTKAADIAFWSGQYQESWRCASSAFRLFPFRRNKLLWRLLIFSLLARADLLPARFTRHNHYLKYQND